MGVVLKYLPREMLYTLMNPHFTIKIGKNRNIYILIYSNGENTQKFFTKKVTYLINAWVFVVVLLHAEDLENI